MIISDNKIVENIFKNFDDNPINDITYLNHTKYSLVLPRTLHGNSRQYFHRLLKIHNEGKQIRNQSKLTTCFDEIWNENMDMSSLAKKKHKRVLKQNSPIKYLKSLNINVIERKLIKNFIKNSNHNNINGIEFKIDFENLANKIKIKSSKLYSTIINLIEKKIIRICETDHDYLYLIQVKNSNIYKIGISSKPQLRVDSVDRYSPFDANILFAVPTFDARNIEKILHNMLEKFHQKHEWYKLSSLSIKYVVIKLMLNLSAFTFNDNDMDFDKYLINNDILNWHHYNKLKNQTKKLCGNFY